MNNEERRKKLGKAIKDHREAQDLSQRRLADMISSNQTYIWEIECGKTSVGFDVLCKIADGLGIQVYELIDF